MLDTTTAGTVATMMENIMRPLRIVTWNCNGALRKKWSALEAFGADVYVIQECENPTTIKDGAYREWASNHLWVGRNKNKGLGVFARNGASLEAVTLDLEPHELFLPCRVMGAPLLASWTLKADSTIPSYIGQLWGVLQHLKGFLDHPHALLAGDLNSNAQWDSRHPTCNHSNVVATLAEMGLRSLYHQLLGIGHGNEPDPTFYLHRKTTKPYHIDYVFAGPGWGLEHIEIGATADWLGMSDHMPLVTRICVTS